MIEKVLKRTWLYLVNTLHISHLISPTSLNMALTAVISETVAILDAEKILIQIYTILQTDRPHGWLTSEILKLSFLTAVRILAGKSR